MPTNNKKTWESLHIHQHNCTNNFIKNLVGRKQVLLDKSGIKPENKFAVTKEPRKCCMLDSGTNYMMPGRSKSRSVPLRSLSWSLAHVWPWFCNFYKNDSPIQELIELKRQNQLTVRINLSSGQFNCNSVSYFQLAHA